MAHRKGNHTMRYLVLIVLCLAIGFWGRDALEYARNNIHFEPVNAQVNQPATRGMTITLGDSHITVM